VIVQILSLLFGVVLLGNMIAFAGVDPISRLVTAAIALFFAVQLRHLPTLPRLQKGAFVGLVLLVVVQLIPLPQGLRTILQPGFADVFSSGWAPLSLAPWATVQMGSSLLIAAVIAAQAARMAQTRSGLPVLLMMIAGTGVVAAILGLTAEAADPSTVLFFRENTGHGSVYGPFVNHNHFAQAMELTLPAAIVLLVVALRRLPDKGLSRQRAVVSALGSLVAIVIGLAALLRSGSRGGILFMGSALLITASLWRRPKHRDRMGPAAVVIGFVFVVIVTLSWTRLPELRERTASLIAVEGLDGNSRIDLWRGTLASWKRSPLVGSGLGTYRYVIGMDKPASGSDVLEQAHNDWLEWGSTSGIVGMGLLAILVSGLGKLLAPSRIRAMRAEIRFALAGATLALTATMLHEVIGFGLQTPVNRYLPAAWVGLVLGLRERSSRRRIKQGEAPS